MGLVDVGACGGEEVGTGDRVTAKQEQGGGVGLVGGEAAGGVDQSAPSRPGVGLVVDDGHRLELVVEGEHGDAVADGEHRCGPLGISLGVRLAKDAGSALAASLRASTPEPGGGPGGRGVGELFLEPFGDIVGQHPGGFGDHLGVAEGQSSTAEVVAGAPQPIPTPPSRRSSIPPERPVARATTGLAASLRAKLEARLQRVHSSVARHAVTSVASSSWLASSSDSTRALSTAAYEGSRERHSDDVGAAGIPRGSIARCSSSYSCAANICSIICQHRDSVRPRNQICGRWVEISNMRPEPGGEP